MLHYYLPQGKNTLVLYIPPTQMDILHTDNFNTNRNSLSLSIGIDCLKMGYVRPLPLINLPQIVTRYYFYFFCNFLLKLEQLESIQIDPFHNSILLHHS